MKKGRVQAKDISDKLMFQVIDKVQKRMQEKYPTWAKHPTAEVWANFSMICEELPEMPAKVVLAKLRALVKRRIISGCTCGCRGDFYFTGAPE